MRAYSKMSPLSPEERDFAEQNHPVVLWYIKETGLNFDEYYGAAVTGYLKAVKNWFERPELHNFSFLKIAKRTMQGYVGSERGKQGWRIQTVSLDGIVPGTDDLMLMDTITGDNLNYVPYCTEGEDMNISYDVPLPENRRKKKSDEVIAIEAFLTTLKMKNMRIEYDTEEEAKKKIISVRSYRNKNKLQEKVDVFRDGKDVYVVKIKKEDQ